MEDNTLNVYKLIALIKRLDLPEAADALHDVLTQVAAGIQQEIQTNVWEDGWKLRSLVHAADRLQELDEELGSVTNTTNFAFSEEE